MAGACWLGSGQRGVCRGVLPAVTRAGQMGLLSWHRDASSASSCVAVEGAFCLWGIHGLGGCSVTWLTAAWRRRNTFRLCVHNSWSVLGKGVSERPMWEAWVKGVGRDAGRCGGSGGDSMSAACAADVVMCVSRLSHLALASCCKAGCCFGYVQ